MKLEDSYQKLNTKLEKSYQKLDNGINNIVSWTFTIIAVISFTLPAVYFIISIITMETAMFVTALFLAVFAAIFWICFFWLFNLKFQIKKVLRPSK